MHIRFSELHLISAPNCVTLNISKKTKMQPETGTEADLVCSNGGRYGKYT